MTQNSDSWASPDFDWKQLPVERVELMTLRPQKLAPSIPRLLKVLLVMAHVLEPRNGDYVPHVVQAVSGEPGNLYIEDGHHRITVLALLGFKTARVRVDRTVEFFAAVAEAEEAQNS